MLEWLRKRESNKTVRQLIENPIEESAKLTIRLADTLNKMDSLNEDERETVRNLYNDIIFMMIDLSGGDPISPSLFISTGGDQNELHWKAFNATFDALSYYKKFESGDNNAILSYLALTLASTYAKSIIIHCNHEDVIDFSSNSNIMETFGDWEYGTNLKTISCRVFQKNPIGGVVILHRVLDDFEY